MIKTFQTKSKFNMVYMIFVPPQALGGNNIIQ